MQTLLLQINEIIKRYDEINKRTGEDFNIFSILGKNKLELAHEKFIGELLNPKGMHNQGDKFLNLFLNILGIEHKLENPNVFLEKVIDKNRRIDIFIKDKEFVIGIEMKISAIDQKNQISDYHQYLKKINKNSYLYYLTPYGKDVEEISKQNLNKDEDYYLISFQDEIYNWIQECIKLV